MINKWTQVLSLNIILTLEILQLPNLHRLKPHCDTYTQIRLRKNVFISGLKYKFSHISIDIPIFCFYTCRTQNTFFILQAKKYKNEKANFSWIDNQPRIHTRFDYKSRLSISKSLAKSAIPLLLKCFTVFM